MESLVARDAASAGRAGATHHHAGRRLIGAAKPSPDLAIEWRDWPAADWAAWLESAGPSSLEQSLAYGAALAATSGCRVRRALVTRAGAPLALVQAFVKPLPLGAGIVRILRGPLFLVPGPEAALCRAVHALVAGSFGLRRGAPLIWTPELPDAPESHALLRGLGKRRMVTGASTLLRELAPPVEELRAGLDGKWRNLLKAGEKAGLSIRLTAGGRPFAWLAARADEQRRRGGYYGPSGDLLRAVLAASPDKADVLTLTAQKGRVRVAGILVLRHGACATYCLGWSGEEGRRLRAHHLLLWRAVLELKKQGVAWFDLGGVNAAAPGIARFKLGLGGKLLTLAGTYI